MRPGKKRLAVDLPILLHEELAKMAKKYHINLTNYVIMVLVERLRNELNWDKKA